METDCWGIRFNPIFISLCSLDLFRIRWSKALAAQPLGW